ncbi:MAG TPA: zinc-binding dehydrogenase [Candidatus Acidoferrales bacterium]|jgi:NADPH:quinone reductase-like Zn-dependent oxidoreductase|nr:zinc-binding dehydrogenase [Candidatus Acidoferrales bacterium]
MRAMVVRRYGPPEVFEMREVPEPQPAPGDVLIRVKAVGINFADLLQRMGLYPGTPRPPFIPGLEVAGIIESVPSGLPGPTSGLEPGARVVAMVAFKAYAERVAIPAAQVFRMPPAMPFEDAAAIPVNYLTAYHSMFHMGNLQPGERILIHGAAGGVGMAAVQLARTRRLVIFGTAGPTKQEVLQRSGVDHPIDYTREDFAQVVRRVAPEGIEMVMDPIGGKSFEKSYDCLGATGRLVVYGLSAAAGPGGASRASPSSLWRGLRALAQTPRFGPLRLMRENTAVIGVQLGRMKGHEGLLRSQLEEIFKLYTAGQIKPVIGQTFPLEQAADAHRYIHARRNIGKVMLIAA